MDDHFDRQALLEELTALRRAVLDRRPIDPDAGGLVLLRLCAGLSLEEWNRLASTPEFREWLALPLSGPPLPSLQRVQDTIKEMSYLIEHDHLTKLANRAAFDRILRSELDRSLRAGASLSLAILDIDDFKKINDAHGHPCGDLALKALAETMLGTKRTYDHAARIGGEEFAVILPGVGLIRGGAMMERLLQAVREIVVPCPKVADGVRFTISAGLACVKGKRSISPETLVEMADAALYQAKNSGKNQVATAPILDLAPPTEKTLVRSDEKHFLFTGETKG